MSSYLDAYNIYQQNIKTLKEIRDEKIDRIHRSYQEEADSCWFLYCAAVEDINKKETKVEDVVIETCARAAHEVNRCYCISMGDFSQPSWENAPDWQKTSARNGVVGVLYENNTPRESHQSWLNEKAATGWKYGPVKDPDKKEHPCFVPYDELPPAQKRKDHIYVTVVRAVADAIIQNEQDKDID